MSELQDLVALIRAETPLLVIETPDESRVIELFRQSLMHAWRALYRWSVTEGLRRLDIDREDESEGAPDLSTALQAIRDAGTTEVHEQTTEEREAWMAELESVYAEMESRIGKETIEMVRSATR